MPSLYHTTTHSVMSYLKQYNPDLVSSVGRAFDSKLSGRGFKLQLDTVGGPVTIIMWGAWSSWKLALRIILLPKVNKAPFLSWRWIHSISWQIRCLLAMCVWIWNGKSIYQTWHHIGYLTDSLSSNNIYTRPSQLHDFIVMSQGVQNMDDWLEWGYNNDFGCNILCSSKCINA